MLDQTNANIERHIKTHTERSDDDRAAVSVLETFLRSNGRINTSFASDDKWPNHDGTFEFAPDPDISRRPKQTFYVQIKGTRNYTEHEGVIKYTLKDLAFPAFICGRVSLDPGILFVILNPAERGDERVFWKYMSPSFLNSIDFAKDSITVSFSPEEEILNNDESVLAFCERLEKIVERHSFVNQLERHSYSFEEAKRIVETCDTEITESIDNLSILNKSRDNISRRILTRLNDLCISALLLNAMKDGYQSPNAGFAWEYSLLRANTKYLGNFYRGLQYIGRRIPEEGQAERLMLKYYSFMWQIRQSLYENYGIIVLQNLEKFQEYTGTDEGITVTVKKIGETTEKALEQVSQEKIIFFLVQVPYGIQKMSGSIEGLVETSINPGILMLNEEECKIVSSVRSSIDSAKDALTAKVCYLSEFLGGDCVTEGDYPAWEYRKESKLRDIMVDSYKELFGDGPEVKAIHAGLECGLFYEKIEGLDAVSFGPTMKDIHTTEEVLSISSTARMWDYLVKVLENIKA